ncbi:MAG: hypothetical protein Q7L55_11900 [Actinomycetota bacterium]|nr:hypothetical protein [Actinomycetota bacterium]
MQSQQQLHALKSRRINHVVWLRAGILCTFFGVHRDTNPFAAGVCG